MVPLEGSLFHEHWWLAAVTGNQFSEVTDARDGKVIGRLPYMVRRRRGFTVSEMPPFTRVLGPLVDPGSGKQASRMLRRFRIIGNLLDQLPRVDYFRQLLDIGNHDVQAFVNRGYEIGIENTFRIDCRRTPSDIWGEMRDKTRNVIRRAEEKYQVASLQDPERFVQFYKDSLHKRDKRNTIDFYRFGTLFSECTAREQGKIIVAEGRDGAPAAMVFLVWDRSVMYYLLSARDVEIADNGAVSLLIWRAILEAHQIGLQFDLDGITSDKLFQFLSGFGGTITTRPVAIRTTPLFNTLRHIRDLPKANWR